MTSTPPQLSPSGTNETFAETDSRLDTPRDRRSIDSGITTSSRSSLLSISERSSFSSHSQQSSLEPRRQTNQYTTSSQSHYLHPIPIEKDTLAKRPRLGHTSNLPLLASLAAFAEAATIVPTRQIRQKRYRETIGIEEESSAQNGRAKRGMRGSGSGSGTYPGHRVGVDQEVCSYHILEQQTTDFLRLESKLKSKPHSPFPKNIEVYTDLIGSTPNRTESIRYPDHHVQTDAQIIHIHPESLFTMIILLRSAISTQMVIPLQMLLADSWPGHWSPSRRDLTNRSWSILLIPIQGAWERYRQSPTNDE